MTRSVRPPAYRQPDVVDRPALSSTFGAAAQLFEAVLPSLDWRKTMLSPPRKRQIADGLGIDVETLQTALSFYRGTRYSVGSADRSQPRWMRQKPRRIERHRDDGSPYWFSVGGVIGAQDALTALMGRWAYAAPLMSGHLFCIDLDEHGGEAPLADRVQALHDVFGPPALAWRSPRGVWCAYKVTTEPDVVMTGQDVRDAATSVLRKRGVDLKGIEFPEFVRLPLSYWSQAPRGGYCYLLGPDCQIRLVTDDDELREHGRQIEVIVDALSHTQLGRDGDVVWTSKVGCVRLEPVETMEEVAEPRTRVTVRPSSMTLPSDWAPDEYVSPDSGESDNALLMLAHEALCKAFGADDDVLADTILDEVDLSRTELDHGQARAKVIAKLAWWREHWNDQPSTSTRPKVLDARMTEAEAMSVKRMTGDVKRLWSVFVRLAKHRGVKDGDGWIVGIEHRELQAGLHRRGSRYINALDELKDAGLIEVHKVGAQRVASTRWRLNVELDVHGGEYVEAAHALRGRAPKRDPLERVVDFWSSTTEDKTTERSAPKRGAVRLDRRLAV